MYYFICTLQQIDISNPDVISYTEMAVSMNNKYIALFTATGFLWIGSADLQVSDTLLFRQDVNLSS